jgi:hypothetical protein
MQESSNKNLIMFILGAAVVVLAVVAGWASWQYYQERITVQEQIDAAVQEAKQEQKRKDEARFEEERKKPYRTYTAPQVFGAIEISFPKTWNVYVEDGTRGSPQIDLTMHPELVRVQEDGDHPWAFRLQLLDQLYEKATRTYRRDAGNGDLNANAITVSGIEGVRYEGKIRDEFEGSLVALPYRDKTILMWTESGRYESEFNTVLERADISR